MIDLIKIRIENAERRKLEKIFGYGSASRQEFDADHPAAATIEELCDELQKLREALSDLIPWAVKARDGVFEVASENVKQRNRARLYAALEKAIACFPPRYFSD